MKQFTYILACVAILLHLSFLVACSDDDNNNSIDSLILDRASIQVKEGSESILKVEQGKGRYQFSFSEEGYADAKYRDDLIYVQGLKYGKVVLTITDQAGNSAKLDVIVVSSVLSTNAERLMWKGNMIEVNKANDWSLTVDQNSVALTNVTSGKQYILSFDGEFTEGVKENAKLEIVNSKTSDDTGIIELAGLEILQIKDGLYSIIFSSSESIGELVFRQ